MRVSPRAAPDVRFWAKVSKDGPLAPGMTTACWLWTQRKDRWGYGKFKLAGREVGAHRFSLLLAGIDPTGLLACHRCDTPACVRPDHIFLGTHLDNMRDMVAKGRTSRRAA
jgi:hypothetical protein